VMECQGTCRRPDVRTCIASVILLARRSRYEPMSRSGFTLKAGEFLMKIPAFRHDRVRSAAKTEVIRHRLLVLEQRDQRVAGTRVAMALDHRPFNLAG